MKRRWGVPGLAVAVLLRAASAHAQPAPAGEPSAVRSERAMNALTAHRPDEAVTLMEAIVEAEPTAEYLYNLALAYRAAGRGARAVESFEQALATSRETFSHRQQRAIGSIVAQLRRQCATLTLAGLPAGAAVRIDGRRAAVRPEGNLVDAGPRVIEVEATGFRALRRELVARAGESVRVELAPEREAPVAVAEPVAVAPPVVAAPVVVAVAAPVGRVVVDPSVAGAVVRIDGVEVGRGHVEREAEAGSHVVEVGMEGYEPFTRTLRVGSTGVTRLDAGLVRRGRAGWVLPVVIAGSVLVVGGIVAGVVVATQPTETPINANWGQINESIVGR